MVNGIALVSKTDASLNFILPASIWFGSVGAELKNICPFQKDLASFAADSTPSGTSRSLWRSKASALDHSFPSPGVASAGVQLVLGVKKLQVTWVRFPKLAVGGVRADSSPM